MKKETFIFKPDGATECYMCGISSFEHSHPIKSKPKGLIKKDIPRSGFAQEINK